MRFLLVFCLFLSCQSEKNPTIESGCNPLESASCADFGYPDCEERGVVCSPARTWVATDCSLCLDPPVLPVCEDEEALLCLAFGWHDCEADAICQGGTWATAPCRECSGGRCGDSRLDAGETCDGDKFTPDFECEDGEEKSCGIDCQAVCGLWL